MKIGGKRGARWQSSNLLSASLHFLFYFCIFCFLFLPPLLWRRCISQVVVLTCVTNTNEHLKLCKALTLMNAPNSGLQVHCLLTHSPESLTRKFFSLFCFALLKKGLLSNRLLQYIWLICRLVDDVHIVPTDG